MIISELQVQKVLNLRSQIKPNRQLNKPDLASCSNETRLVKATLSQVPETRSERVTNLKDTISQGIYQPPAAHIATKMVNRSIVDNALSQVRLK